MTNAVSGRATGRRHRGALLPLAALLLSAVAAACSNPGSPTNAVPPSSPTKAVADPRDLVGAWESARPGTNTTLAYRFTEENKYKYIGLLTYSMGAEGAYELTHIVEGTYEASTDSLTLKPRSATVTRKNPENPERDYTNRPARLETQHYRWTVADRKLSLVRRDGTEFVFRWVSP
ncbi:hypothetical protein AB0C70_18340 [Streptomyces sp. NPDC048564]|uniref:hypothetical protein n=1 Tax=Streptomyces sp. NPDC048564 TaxID=3155760 RepID=UPI003434F233